MATTDRPSTTIAASDVADAVQTAEFLCIIGRRDGGGVAAAGLIAMAAAHVDTPYQVSVTETVGDASSRATTTDSSASVLTLGHPIDDADIVIEAGDLLQTAYSTATALNADPDPALALAGAVASGGHPGDVPTAQSALHDAGSRRDNGVPMPTDDRVEALAFSTLVHGPFSGRREGAEDLLDELDSDPDPRTVASAVALAVTGDDSTPASASEAVERFLNPFSTDGQWPSVEAFADVLTATARTDPGVALTLAMGDASVEPVRDRWRTFGSTVQDAVRAADLARYDGVIETSVPTHPAQAARLIRDYRSPEPAAIVIGAEKVALATTDIDARATLASIAGIAPTAGHDSVATVRTEMPEETAATIREEL